VTAYIVYTCFKSTSGCHAWGKMSWTLEWKRIPRELIKITGQVCKAFFLHHGPCAWSTAHVGELVTTQKNNLPLLGKGHFQSLFRISYNLVQPWNLPDHQTS